MPEQDDQPKGFSSKPPPWVEGLRAKLAEHDVDQRLERLATTVEHAVQQGVARAGELAHDHQDDIARLLDRAEGAVERRTDGKHAETIRHVRGSLERGVEKLARQRPSSGER